MLTQDLPNLATDETCPHRTGLLAVFLESFELYLDIQLRVIQLQALMETLALFDLDLAGQLHHAHYRELPF